MRAALLLAALLLHGCAYLDILGGDPQPRIDRWVEERQYGKALALLARIPPEHPRFTDLQQRRPRIEALAAAYESEVVQRAEALVAQGEWAEALALYGTAMDDFPDGERLRTSLDAVRQRQQKEASEVEEELLLERAVWLAKSLPLYRQLAITRPESAEARRRHRTAVEQAALLAERLYQRGMRASEEDDLRRAVRLLRAAASLDDSPAIHHAQAEVLEARQVLAKQAQRAHERTVSNQRRKTADRLVAACRAALADRDYLGARDLFERIEALDAEAPEVRELEREFTAAVESRTRLLVDEGTAHYSAGRFEEALERWSEVLELDPAHAEAKEHLGRTKRILENLRELREKQAG